MTYIALINIGDYKEGQVVPDHIAETWITMYKESPVSKSKPNDNVPKETKEEEIVEEVKPEVVTEEVKPIIKPKVILRRSRKKKE